MKEENAHKKAKEQMQEMEQFHDQRVHNQEDVDRHIEELQHKWMLSQMKHEKLVELRYSYFLI